MNEHEEIQIKTTVRARGRMMDFAPRTAIKSAPHQKSEESFSDGERRRRELARKEIARREEIHRQIEAQKEQDLIAERRAIAARKDLARRLEAEREENAEALAAREKEFELRREREEKAKRRALIEARALRERQRILAERRARRARAELEARREAENKMRPVPIHEVKNPRGSLDPLARRMGSVKEFEKELDNLEKTADSFIEDSEEIEEFVEDKKEEYLDDIDAIGQDVEEEKVAKNNARYVLGGRSPFINTAVEKRPLSGGTKTYEPTDVSVYEACQKSLNAKKGRYVPYNEPLPHKNIYARTVEKEKNNNHDLPTVVVGNVSKGSKASLIIAILLTVILGATVGAIAYLALFQ